MILDGPEREAGFYLEVHVPLLGRDVIEDQVSRIPEHGES